MFPPPGPALPPSRCRLSACRRARLLKAACKVAHTELLNTAVAVPVMHEHVPAAIDRNAAGQVELRISTALAANGSCVVYCACS
jgi:hypothetical protein